MVLGFIEDYRFSYGLFILDVIIGVIVIVYNILFYIYNIKDFGFLFGIKFY